MKRTLKPSPSPLLQGGERRGGEELRSEEKKGQERKDHEERWRVDEKRGGKMERRQKLRGGDERR